MEPFYLEDTDLGFMAWKRGWKVLYQPRSVVYHEHRGTIGKRFREDQIQAVLKKNFLLFCWKNIHEWRELAPHFAFAWAGALIGVLFGDASGRPNLPRSVARVPAVAGRDTLAPARARAWRASPIRKPSAARLAGTIAIASPPSNATPAQLRVLFVSPYPICPPVHGGGVFMYQTLREMTKLAEVHVVEIARLARIRKKTTWNCASSAPRPNGLCVPAANRATWGRCCHTRCASSPIPISSG